MAVKWMRRSTTTTWTSRASSRRSGTRLENPARLLPDFHAAFASRQHLSRIQAALGIKQALEALDHLQAIVGELFGDQLDIFHAHAVLAGDGAAFRDAEAQDIVACGLGALELAGMVRIEQDDRMH